MIASIAQPSTVAAPGGTILAEGAGPAAPFSFAALLSKPGFAPGASESVVEAQVAPEPATVAAGAEVEEDSGPVPDGLEEVADTLAAALAAVFAAAGKTVAPPFGRVESSAPASAPAPAQSALLTITPPITVAPAIAEATAQASVPLVLAKLDLLAKPETPELLTALDPALPDQPAASADALPELRQLPPLSAPALTAPTVAAAPSFTVDAPAAQPASSSEIVMSHHLDLAKDGEWLDRLARDIARTASNDAQLRFQLNPEHLGSLRVELANTADGTAIRLTADTEAARNILADAQPRLLAEARAQGLRISEAQVDLGGQGGQQRGGRESPEAFVRTQQPGDESTAQPSRSAAERYA